MGWGHVFFGQFFGNAVLQIILSSLLRVIPGLLSATHAMEFQNVKAVSSHSTVRFEILQRLSQKSTCFIRFLTVHPTLFGILTVIALVWGWTLDFQSLEAVLLLKVILRFFEAVSSLPGGEGAQARSKVGQRWSVRICAYNG